MCIGCGDWIYTSCVTWLPYLELTTTVSRVWSHSIRFPCDIERSITPGKYITSVPRVCHLPNLSSLPWTLNSTARAEPTSKTTQHFLTRHGHLTSVLSLLMRKGSYATRVCGPCHSGVTLGARHQPMLPTDTKVQRGTF